MINIASLYYFTLLERLSPEYKSSVSQILENISEYLDIEGIQVKKIKRKLSGYELIAFSMKNIGSIQFFHKDSKSADHYYYPTFYCDIHVDKKYLQDSQEKKKIIFLLSNIFECFDWFDERNLLIEFHRAVQDTYTDNQEYNLRYDFININSLSHIYSKRDIQKEIQTFVSENAKMYNMSSIKTRFPDLYRTLVFFIYNIFAMQKAHISWNNQLSEIQDYERVSWENMHISLSEERLKINQKTLKKTLTLYQTNFENFLDIMMK